MNVRFLWSGYTHILNGTAYFSTCVWARNYRDAQAEKEKLYMWV